MRRATPPQLHRSTVASRAAARIAARSSGPSARIAASRSRSASASPFGKRTSPRSGGRVRLLEPLPDLGEARVVGDDRRAACGRRLRRDHPERLREDRRHGARVGEREEMDEVPVRQRAGEEHVEPLRLRLELGAEVAEPDDHGAGVEAAKRLEQHLHALVADQLPVEDDGLPVSGQERGEPLGVARVGKPLVAVPGVRWVVARLGEQRGEGIVARLRPPELDVDAGRDRVDSVDGAADLGHDIADVLRADQGSLRSGEHVRAPARELLVAAHRVLELRAVRLHDVRQAARCSDRPPEQDVVDEHEVCAAPRPERGGIVLDPALELCAAALLHARNAVAGIVVEDEHGQQAVHVRPDRLRPAQVVTRSDQRPARRPSHRVPRDSTPVPAAGCRCWSRCRRGGSRARRRSASRQSQA